MNSKKDRSILGELERYNRELRDKDEQLFFLREDVKRLEKDAIIDRRTQLYSPTFFYARLKEEIARSERYRHFFSLILIHLRRTPADSTQNLLDRLKILGRQINAVLSRGTDLIANLERSQLVVILPETDSSGAEVVLERYRAVLDVEERPACYEVVSFPRDASNLEMLLAKIDEISARVESQPRPRKSAVIVEPRA